MKRSLCACALLMLIGALTVPAAPLVIAETDAGPVVADDLAFRIRYYQELPEDELELPETQQRLPDLIRLAAVERILLHRAETEGLFDDPVHQAHQEEEWERFFVHHAQRTMIENHSYPTVEEIRERAEEIRSSILLPPTAAWRFMLFAADATSPEALDEARALVGEAREAVAAGESFEDVAARLSTPPADRRPGRLIGPVEFQGLVLPPIEEALLTLPLGEVSEPIETPIGPILLLVEERDTERRISEYEAIGQAGTNLRAERREVRREEVLQELLERYAPEVSVPESLDAPDETVVLRLGERTVTLGDLRRQVVGQSDPEEALRFLLGPIGLPRLLADNLFLAEMEATGATSDPELLTQCEALRRYNTLDELLIHFDALRVEEPTPEEIEAHYEAHGEDFIQEVWTAEALWINARTLAELASSELGFDLMTQMESIRQRWVSGEDPAAILEEIGVTPSQLNGFERWEQRLPGGMPPDLRDLLASLEPGQFSDVIFGPSGAVVVHLVAREQGLPPLGDIHQFVRSAIMEERMPELTLEDEMLEAYHYRQTVDVSRLRWADDTRQEIILLPEETETD